MKNDKKWYQFIIVDDAELSGNSVHKLTSLIMDLDNIQTVIIKDLVGSIEGLRDCQGKSLSAENFLQNVGLAIQYDWSFFYMFKNDPSTEIAQADNKTLLKFADITVRLADDLYFYIYTTDAYIIGQLKHFYPNADLSTLAFDELEILY